MSIPSDDDIRDELDHHLASREQLNQQQGLAPEQARRQSQLTFGNRTAIHEQTREAHLNLWFEDLRRDMLYAIRSFTRTPALPFAAILVLALGIGSATAVFSVVDRILFRSLPYPDSSQLVAFGIGAPLDKSEFMLHPEYVKWRTAQQPFQLTAATKGANDCDLTEADPQRLRCVPVERTLLPMLGIQPYRGTNFTPTQDTPNGPRVAIISHALWVTRYGSSESIIGRTIVIDGNATEVIGVLPPVFEMPTLQKFDILTPLQIPTASSPNGPQFFLRTFARLKPNVTLSQASQSLTPLFKESLNTVPPSFRKEVSLRITSLQDRQIGDSRSASWLLLAAVGAVFLIACANLANLLIARTAARERELSIRLSIGASRFHILRQILTESLLLSSVASIAGIAMAFGLLKSMTLLAPAGILRLEEATLDLRVLAYAVAISIFAALIAGLAPALQLPSAHTRTTSSAQPRLRLLLVTTQIAASMILLTSAALLLQSLWNLQSTPLGFQTENVIATRIALGRSGYQEPGRRQAFFTQLEAFASAAPGSTAFALSDSIPPLGPMQAMIFSNIEVEHRPKPPQPTGGMVPQRVVSPSFFSILGIPIRKGRTFNDQDRQSAERTVVINELLAQRLFPQQDAIGQRLRFGAQGEWHNVIGVVGSVNNNGLAAREPEYYFARKINQDSGHGFLLIRTTSSPAVIESWLKQQLAAINPTLPITSERLSTKVTELSVRPRFQAILLTTFALLGLLLAVLGLYGVITFLVTQRTRELGVRLALGATASNIRRLILKQASQWTVAGLSIGLIAAWFSTSLLDKLLYQVTPRNPATWLIAASTLLAAALFAAWLPARRAGRIDPAIALRSDG